MAFIWSSKLILSFILTGILIGVLLAISGVKDINKDNEPLTSSDLSLKREDVFLSKETPVEGDHVQITVEVQNYGDIDASAEIGFYDGDPTLNNKIGSDSISISRHGFSRATVEWDLTSIAGKRVVWIQIEDTKPRDIDLSNNKISKEISIGFTYQLQPGKNSISLTLSVSYNASSLAKAIIEQGGSCTKIEKFDTNLKEWLTFTPGNGKPSSNFIIDPCIGFNIYSNSSSEFTIYGDIIEIDKIKLFEGWNFQGWSFFRSINASELAELIGVNCKNIIWYNSFRESNEAYLPGISGSKENFVIEPGYGLLIYVEKDVDLELSLEE